MSGRDDPTAAERRLQYLASFPETNPLPVVEADVRGCIRYANPASARLFPDLADRGSDHPWLSGWTEVVECLRRAGAEGISRNVVVGARVFEQRLFLLADDEVVRAYGFDVTDRTRAEEQIRLFIEHAPAALAMLDREMRYLAVSRRWLSDYHLGDRDLRGLSHYDVFPEIADEWKAFHRRAMEGDVVRSEADRFARRDGSVLYLRWEVRPWREVSGQIGGIVILTEDVTDVRRAGEEARASQQWLAMAQDAARAGTWQWDLRTGENVWSDGLWKVYGLTKGSVAPSYDAWRDAVIPEDRDRAEAAVREAAQTASELSVEFRVRHANGDVRDLLSRGRPLFGPDGRPEKFLGIVLDITDRRRFEDELRAANERLRETDRRKNDFLAILSHELRNPLAPIRNGLYILERAAPGSEQARRALAVIDRQTGLLARLVDDLLDVTRISRDKIQLKRRQLDLNDLVRRTVEDHRSLFDQRKLRVETDVPAEPFTVEGDAARLTQVVGNLLQNAAKFTPVGGRVRVATGRTPSLDRWVLRVSDNGTGIEPTMLDRVFEPFMQAETTLDRSMGGLGLGLALVKGLVEMHGGEVRAHSDGPGKGAEFTIELPLARVEAAAGASTRVAARGTRRVLIIEDHADAASSLREVLELLGHVVETVHDGPAGLEAARLFKPDLVLCDIGLPGMDGFQVAREFRADPSLAGIALVALSGYALPEDLQRAAEAGFTSHLAKPPSSEALDRVLADLAEGRESGIEN